MASRKHRGVYENPKGSGIWWILYYDADGRRHREKVGRNSLAIEAYIQRKSEIRARTFSPPSRKDRISFKELATLCLEDKKNRITPASYYNEAHHLKHWISVFGQMSASSIPTARIAQSLNDLRKGRTNSTVNLFRMSLGSVFTFGIRTGRIHLEKNPIAAVRPFKENAWRIRYLHADEEESVRKEIRELYPDREPELDLALNTGMRRGEQFSLTWDAIDLELGVLTCYGKTGRRFIPLNEGSRTAIERLQKLSTGSSFVIPERKERDTRKDWRKWFETCVKEAGVVNFKWHDLRHTFASRLVMRGADLPTVQQLLGHKSILMTMRYAHLSGDHKKATIAKLDVAADPKAPRVVRMRRRA